MNSVDGYSGHNAIEVALFLENAFQNGRKNTCYPLRSSDLTPLHLFLSRCVKQTICGYQHERQLDLDHLWDKIVENLHSITPQSANVMPKVLHCCYYNYLENICEFKTTNLIIRVFQ